MESRPSKADETVHWVTGILCAVALVIGAVHFLLWDGPFGHRGSQESSAMQTTRTLELAMFQYAADHDGYYPTGRSSTEVFQKLVNGKYITEPAIFYLPMPGKTRATSSNLAANNVAYDVTVSMTGTTPDGIPGVFATGYHIDYMPGGRATPIGGRDRPNACADGLPVAYHSNSAWYRSTRDPSGIVTNVVPSDVIMGSNTYTQLTPDGPLPH